MRYISQHETSWRGKHSKYYLAMNDAEQKRPKDAEEKKKRGRTAALIWIAAIGFVILFSIFGGEKGFETAMFRVLGHILF